MSNASERARSMASKAPGGKSANEFKEFILRGNVVDLAVGVVMATAFGAVVTALVSKMIMPLTTVAMKDAPKFEELSFKAGGAEFGYGAVIAAIISFLIIALVVFFFIVKPVSHLMSRNKTEPDSGEETKECTECLSSIPAAARRCAFCTSEQSAAL